VPHGSRSLPVQVVVEAHPEAAVEEHHEDGVGSATVADVEDPEVGSAVAEAAVDSQEVEAAEASREVEAAAVSEAAAVVVASEDADVEVTEHVAKTLCLYIRAPRRSPADTTVIILRRLGVVLGVHVKDAIYGAMMGTVQMVQGHDL
jgi:hypothetical protein